MVKNVLFQFASSIVVVLVVGARGESVVRKADRRDTSAFDSADTMVRRTNDYYSSYRQADTLLDDALHYNDCVVWGDWTFDGMRFASHEEAKEHFQNVKRTELAALHMHGSNEVNRFMSNRLVSVKWAKMKAWCDAHEGEAAGSSLAQTDKEDLRQRVELRVNRNGAISDASEGERSIFDDPLPSESSPSPRHAHNSFHQSYPNAPEYHTRPEHHHHAAAPADTPPDFRRELPKRRSRPMTSSFAMDQTASTLSGKVSLLEQEAVELNSKALDVFKSIGVNGANVGTSFSQAGPAGEPAHKKLKSRLIALEELTIGVQMKTDALETEFFGTTTADKLSNERKDIDGSFKSKIEAVTMKVEELKGKISALESSPLLGEIAKLEQKAADLGQKSSNIFAVIGVESAMAAASPAANGVLKERLSALEKYADDVQRSAAALEYEILGNSWNLPAVGGESQRGACIKDHAGSLGNKLNDLESRISALATAPIIGDVSKMEEALTSLATRSTTLSKNVGIGEKISETDFNIPKTATLTARVAFLESGVEKMQSTTSSLEAELAGNVGTMPAHSQKDTLKGKAKSLELQVENLNSRISSLEQQV
jgi:hypothetical protein